MSPYSFSKIAYYTHALIFFSLCTFFLACIDENCENWKNDWAIIKNLYLKWLRVSGFTSIWLILLAINVFHMRVWKIGSQALKEVNVSLKMKTDQRKANFCVHTHQYRSSLWHWIFHINESIIYSVTHFDLRDPCKNVIPFKRFQPFFLSCQEKEGLLGDRIWKVYFNRTDLSFK